MLTVSVLPGQQPQSLARARITQAWKDDSGRVYARARVSLDGHWLEWDRLGTFRFRPPDRTVTAWAAPGVPDRRLRDAFHRFLQPIALQALGHTVLHASASATPDGAFAFCGLSGSGKSTIAYGLSRIGCRQLADDALALDVSEDDITVHPSPFAPRLRPSAVDALGPASPSTFPATTADGTARLGAVVILTQEPGLREAVRAVRLPEFQAFARVLTHAHSFDPDSAEESARLSREYLDLVSRVPVFDVTYRPDFSCLSEVMATVVTLSSLKAAGPATR